MSPDVIGILSVGVATGALFVAGMHAVRDVLLGRAGEPPERRGGGAGRAGTRGHAGDRPTGPAGGQRVSSSDRGGADRSRREERHDAARAAGGNAYDPRPRDDKARRTITYLLIALLAFTVTALLAMVSFGLISVAEVEEFNVIVATLVPLVTAAIVYYFRSKGGSDG